MSLINERPVNVGVIFDQEVESGGGFQQGLLRRLDVPLRVHGSQSSVILERYGIDNPEWPYGIIENLYSHFRIAEVPNESDDPFGDDDDFELIP